RHVEQGAAVAGLGVLGGGVAEVGGHQPAGLLGEDGAGLRGDVVQGCLLGHGLTLPFSAACGLALPGSEPGSAKPQAAGTHAPPSTASALWASSRNRHGPPASSRRCTWASAVSGVANSSSTVSSGSPLRR